MKKYLFIGLAVLIGTNLVALGGVAYNRMGEATTQLTLTERELTLRSSNLDKDENSGISLYINWRTPASINSPYYAYNSRDFKISKDEMFALGFKLNDIENNYRGESRELFWVLEFDGALHKDEIKKAADKYKTAEMTYAEQQNDNNKRDKKQYFESLQREKTSNSRLFFIEAATDYITLAKKFSEQQNILIVKGVARPYYDHDDKTYSLSLERLAVSSIMVPMAQTDILSELKRPQNRDINPPRYTVHINWGSRLEPWVIDVEKLDY